MLDGTWFFECSCGSPEHSIRFTLDKGLDGDDYPMIYGDFYLEHYLPWYRRIWAAIKYILKLPPQHEHFANWTMRNEDAKRLKEMCEDFLDE